MGPRSRSFPATPRSRRWRRSWPESETPTDDKVWCGITQGSGKTLVMAFAAAKLRQQTDLDPPTILIVLDRLDLIEQTRSEFTSVGIPMMKVAETKDQLRRLLRNDDARGVIVTIIFRFADAGLLNDRQNIVVMVDEAHRTQEGRLGMDMRQALPNAKFIGLTGTPISTEDRNTWETFGDPDDTDGVINHYSVERSIADGATLPIHEETRLVNYRIDATALDQAFDELAHAEGLDEREAGLLAKRGVSGRSDHEVTGSGRGGHSGHRQSLSVQDRADGLEGSGGRVRPGVLRVVPPGD